MTDKRLEKIILNMFGAVKYDDGLTEGSPFQGMYVYDNGKSAFPETTLESWVAQFKSLIQENYISKDKVRKALAPETADRVTDSGIGYSERAFGRNQARTEALKELDL